ncbi:MAG: DNA primase [Mesorhizobium sp.]|uniref:DUF7146 domain-containing protein n=1 Tax=Mesorhizobium sp. TaxID=1871066 RepID=UPI000FE488FE|nr:toprim domain-containing protein [Mesorhizobium sp.]RWH71776.1 MAG: DNA primase [Mesorhizobium sp.]RWH85566.1 MAG: DNA primase [Mesorhizobium sp.]RWH94702.1 MAG: DNA primase [Mesorhizobium sp.]RWH99504.1 MAG: DNA primase [Mesorhizobium sp.]RWI22197.1 MAG: DNA primase [Mesorhizobium sp.]
MREPPHELARRLADRAEAVCRHYLSNGRRQGNYWTVGDVRNTPGRSMFVRLAASPRGPAGRWTDAATGEHGDLLDVVREALGLETFADVAKEARVFLGLSHEPAPPELAASQRARAPAGSTEAARRLVGMSQPIIGTIVETYLRGRGITTLHGTGSLRFHPRCYYRADDDGPTETWPAMIGSVTNLDGRLTGAHRTWLAPNGLGKAPVETPRRAMGDLLGNAVRFGVPGSVMAAGEGIETTLSLRCALPDMAMAAALSAAHLAGILFPPTLNRLYIIRDNDPAGDSARDSLIERATDAGIEALVLSPRMEDFNEDLRYRGLAALRKSIADQLVRRDRHRFLERVA